MGKEGNGKRESEELKGRARNKSYKAEQQRKRGRNLKIKVSMNVAAIRGFPKLNERNMLRREWSI